uniref:relaxase/mobilization nuclease domain-containing protein n=1 Tax=Sphingomonas sp. GlSt437 TaxID=3389970 RepID=UPI003A89E341
MGRRHGWSATARRGQSNFGRGRTAFARSRLFAPSRRVAVKVLPVVQRGRMAPLSAHLAYLKREGVTREGSPAHMFGADTDRADDRAFAERCKDDRHHFRIIVSPEDATELSDLREYTRDLVRQMEVDLGTRLEWVAVDHWNTDNPHVHLLVRGVDDQGADLRMSREYISHNLRSRAEELAFAELGPKPPQHEPSRLPARLERDGDGGSAGTVRAAIPEIRAFRPTGAGPSFPTYGPPPGPTGHRRIRCNPDCPASWVTACLPAISKRWASRTRGRTWPVGDGGLMTQLSPGMRELGTRRTPSSATMGQGLFLWTHGQASARLRSATRSLSATHTAPPPRSFWPTTRQADCQQTRYACTAYGTVTRRHGTGASSPCPRLLPRSLKQLGALVRRSAASSSCAP